MEVSNLSEYEIIHGYVRFIRIGNFHLYYSPLHSIKLNRYNKLGYI